MALDVTSTGIAFTPQGGSNVNLLDDYEEGTWALLIQGSATGGDEVSEFQVDRNAYTKIGNMVQIEFRVQENSNAPSNTNAFTVKGIPFASAATAWHAIGHGSATNYYNMNLMLDNYAAETLNFSHGTAGDYLLFNQIPNAGVVGGAGTYRV
jgi:hypothetical protein